MALVSGYQGRLGYIADAMKIRSSLGWPAVLMVLVATTGTGCITRTATTVVYDDGATKIELRSRTGVDRAFGHPVTVAPVRLAYVLSRIDVRKSVEAGQASVPAFATSSKASSFNCTGLGEGTPRPGTCSFA